MINLAIKEVDVNISKVSKQFNISTDTLRYYEKINLIPPITRKNGIRDYKENDLNWINFIKCMRSAGLSIDALIRYVKLFDEGDSTNEARKNILIEQRKQLKTRMSDMQKSLDMLDYKISVYESKMLTIEKELRKK